MANRRDNLPKTFRIVACNRCGSDFQSSGPNHKRCDGCKVDHKREYERVQKRASKSRRTTCLRCDEPFAADVHAHTKYCAPCAVAARNESSVVRYAADTVRHREYGLRHYQKNKVDILKRRKTEAWRKGAAKRQRRRRDSDPSFRLHCNVSRLISMALNGGKAGRKWQDLVGYTLEQLRAHLERQFVKGMTWDNYGTVWHVDHIQPRTKFTFESSDDDGFKACWALTNLRPLGARDNMSKGSKAVLLL